VEEKIKLVLGLLATLGGASFVAWIYIRISKLIDGRRYGDNSGVTPRPDRSRDRSSEDPSADAVRERTENTERKQQSDNTKAELDAGFDKLGKLIQEARKSNKVVQSGNNDSRGNNIKSPLP